MLDPGNINYLLWAIIGYMIATAVLVVAFGRLGDQFGWARMYNLGFAIFTAASIALSLLPGQGDFAAVSPSPFRRSSISSRPWPPGSVAGARWRQRDGISRRRVAFERT
jgi:MFS family permease